MQSTTLRGGFLIGLCLGGLTGCGSGDSAILATLGTAPTRTSQLTVTATLDGKPAMQPFQLQPTADRFGVDLPSALTGHLTLNAQAVDADACLQAASSADVTLPSGRIDVSMQLVPQSPRKCGSLAPCAASTVCPTTKVQTQPINSMWAISPRDIWAVGSSATALHYDGTTWSPIPLPPQVTQSLWGVWASTSDSVWAVGASGVTLHYDGNVWTVVNNPLYLGAQTLWGVWGVSSSDVWAVGDPPDSVSQGAFMHYNGSTWTQVFDTGLGIGRFNSVWADSKNFIYAAGVKGLLVRYNSNAVPTPGWAIITPAPTTLDLHAVWGTSGGANSSKVFAVGDNGTIFRIRYGIDSSWSSIASTGTASTLYGIYGDDSQFIYAVGSSGAIVRADGPSYDSFVAQSNPAVSTLFAVHPVSTGIIWMGGAQGFLGYLDARP